MQLRVKIYVFTVVVLAFAASLIVYRTAPAITGAALPDALLLCSLAVAGELLSFVLPYNASGTIGYIPYFAAAVLVPGWPSVVGVLVVRLAMESISRRAAIKKTLNVSSYVLMEATAILAYSRFGGIGLLHAAGKASLTHVAGQFGIAAIGAFTVAFAVNNLVIFVVIALESRRSVRSVIVEGSRSTVILDLITTPLIFVFAWVYAAFGAVAGAALWVPILGLRQVHRINLELERTNEELLELMVKSLEARDPYTSGHSRRVQHYALIIARALELPDRNLDEIGHAALLHDVGKIYEKYAPVLAKQDKLTPEEWAIIQDHPVDGANLVATMTRLRDMVPSIRHHHENWDGTGYPDCLAGESIPLASRIIRFADTIDAMTTERPYRRPLTATEVKSELVRCRGTQFDPMITDRLLLSPLWSSLFSSPAIAEPVPSTKFAIIGSGQRTDASRGIRTGRAN